MCFCKKLRKLLSLPLGIKIRLRKHLRKLVLFCECFLGFCGNETDNVAVASNCTGKGNKHDNVSLKCFLNVKNVVRIEDLNIVEVYVIIIDISDNCL